MTVATTLPSALEKTQGKHSTVSTCLVFHHGALAIFCVDHVTTYYLLLLLLLLLLLVLLIILLLLFSKKVLLIINKEESHIKLSVYMCMYHILMQRVVE